MHEALLPALFALFGAGLLLPAKRDAVQRQFHLANPLRPITSNFRLIDPILNRGEGLIHGPKSRVFQAFASAMAARQDLSVFRQVTSVRDPAAARFGSRCLKPPTQAPTIS